MKPIYINQFAGEARYSQIPGVTVGIPLLPGYTIGLGDPILEFKGLEFLRNAGGTNPPLIRPSSKTQTTGISGGSDMTLWANSSGYQESSVRNRIVGREQKWP